MPTILVEHSLTQFEVERKQEHNSDPQLSSTVQIWFWPKHSSALEICHSPPCPPSSFAASFHSSLTLSQYLLSYPFFPHPLCNLKLICFLLLSFGKGPTNWIVNFVSQILTDQLNVSFIFALGFQSSNFLFSFSKIQGQL